MHLLQKYHKILWFLINNFYYIIEIILNNSNIQKMSIIFSHYYPYNLLQIKKSNIFLMIL